MSQPRLKRSTLKERANELRRIEALPFNPVRDFRLTSDLSHEQLGKKAGLTKQAIIRAEQGCYEEIPDDLLQLMVQAGHSELVLRDTYEAYRQEMRRRNYHYFGDRLTYPGVSGHPFKLLLEVHNTNATQVAKDLCLSQATLQYWLKHPKRQKSVPQSVRKALWDIGYKTGQIDSLEYRYGEYRAGL